MSKISDVFPVSGGAIGAATTQTKQFMFLPTWEAIVVTLILSIIGAIVGYLVKMLIDIVFYKIKKTFKRK